MLEIVLYLLLGPVLVLPAALALITVKFYSDKSIEKKVWAAFRAEKMPDPGTVAGLSVLPLVEAAAAGDGLAIENGVSYLITAGDKKFIFDVGFNRKGEHPSPLLRNMEQLGIALSDIDFIFISHPHPDHVGGMKAKRNDTFSLSSVPVDLSGMKVYSHSPLNYPGAEIEIISKPKKIAEGIVAMGPIFRAQWLAGLSGEQSLAINVAGKGIVLIVGCGHPSLEKIIARAEDLFEAPLYGIIGGLHFPVTVKGITPLRFFGHGKLPWQRVEKKDVKKAIALLREKKPVLVALSPHDSCGWARETFARTFGDNYSVLCVGKQITL